jgi:hypothetical protein
MKIACIATLSTAVLLLTGCQSRNADVSFDAIMRNPTPELQGIADRPDDVRRHYAMSTNQNMRAFWDDLARALYLDKPTSLSPYELYNTSGNPR